MKILFSELMGGQLDVAKSNIRPELRYCLADAAAGISASIYKRATDEVDFFSLTSSNLSENDIDDFEYGLIGEDEEGVLTSYPVEEDGTNGYLRGTDRRILPRAVPEELEQNFEPQGSEILDVEALLELEEKVAGMFDEAPEDVRQFRIRASGLHGVVESLDKRFTLKEWVQRGLIHFQPQSFHNQATEEYVFRVYKPDIHIEGDWRAVMSVIEDGQRVDIEYPVDIQASLRASDELPTDQELFEAEGGVPMFGSLRTVIEHNYRDEPYEKTVVVLSRPYEKGVRVAVQDLGPSGMRMPAISEKYYRPVSVIASKASRIKLEDTFVIPFDGDPESGPRAARDAVPFTLQVDDLFRLTQVFEEDDSVEVTYLHTHDPDSIIPVRFESVREFKTKDDQGRPHFIRKVAYVAAVRPTVNGKVVIQ